MGLVNANANANTVLNWAIYIWVSRRSKLIVYELEANTQSNRVGTVWKSSRSAGKAPSKP
jgi:hypothetical protein